MEQELGRLLDRLDGARKKFSIEERAGVSDALDAVCDFLRGPILNPVAAFAFRQSRAEEGVK
jgi:hypothetical protein